MARRTTASPRQDPNGSWSYVVDAGKGPNGERRQIKRRGFRTKREAQASLDKVRVSSREGHFVGYDGITVAEWFDSWLSIRQVAPSTRDSYQRKFDSYVRPELGGKRLQSIEGRHLTMLYRALEQSGGRNGNPLSPRTVRFVHTVLQKSFADAVKAQRLVRNPAHAAEPPTAKSAKSPQMRVWSSDETSRFLSRSEMEDDRWYPLWFFLATTGCRRGEALGVRWADLDLDAGTAWVRQTLGVVNGEATFRTTTKTGEHRRISLDASTVRVLRDLRRHQNAERLAMGSGWAALDLVFTWPDGSAVNPDRVTRNFKRRVVRWGLPDVRLHDLRHGWASLALQAGVPLVVVSEQLGHKSIAVTADIYSHVTPSMTAGATKRVAGLILGG